MFLGFKSVGVASACTLLPGRDTASLLTLDFISAIYGALDLTVDRPRRSAPQIREQTGKCRDLFRSAPAIA